MSGSQEVDGAVVNDRALLSRVGVVGCVVALDRDMEIIGDPAIISRGVFNVDDNPELIASCQKAVAKVINNLDISADEDKIRAAARGAINRIFKRKYGRRPVVVAELIFENR